MSTGTWLTCWGARRTLRPEEFIQGRIDGDKSSDGRRTGGRTDGASVGRTDGRTGGRRPTKVDGDDDGPRFEVFEQGTGVRSERTSTKGVDGSPEERRSW